jgi:lipid A 3-O-deacylase
MKRTQGALLILVMIVAIQRALAQAETNTGIERDIHSNSYVRLNYGNDYFTGTDHYLSQTIYLEWVSAGLKRSLVHQLLLKPSAWENRNGIAIEHNAYTPVFFERLEIQYGDRPFAGALFGKIFSINTDTEKHQRLSTSLSMGILGKGSGAKTMQTFIHENTPNAIPHGWDNQIQNDIVLNYEASYQKQLFEINDFFLATADVTARLGTLSTKARVGMTFMAGYFNSPFASLQIKSRKIQLYVYDHPELNVVGYDATMQGGLFNRSSVYVIPTDQVNRVVFRNNWGVVARIGKVYLEYYQSFMTREFKSGMQFHNGGIQIGLAF